MLKLFLTMAYRNLLRDRLTSAIQIIGLAIGISCFLLIQHYVAYELSFNSQFSHANEIYRVDLIRDENKPQALTPLRLSQELIDNFDDISDATRISAATISINVDASMYAERALFVDKNFFEFFDFPLIEGDTHTALNAPNSVILFQNLAHKYFGGTENVIGKTLTINGNEYLVTGVIKEANVPHTIPTTMLLPIKRYFDLLPNAQWISLWNFNATVTFAKVANSNLMTEVTQRVSEYYDKRAKGLSSYKSNRVQFEPLTNVHLNNQTSRSLVPPGSESMIVAFQIIGMLILFLACVNATSLGTVSAMRRGKDVGVRKAIGAGKLQLVCQYLIEAIMVTLMAAFIAIGLIKLCLPWFNQLMNVELTFVLNTNMLTELLLLVVIVGGAAGIYPAFYLSNMSTAMVLKGVIDTSKGSLLLRRGLIVIQFAITAFLLVASFVVNWQMTYVENMPLGFERQNVIVVNRGAEIYDFFKTRALQLPGVSSVTMSHTVPTKATRTSHNVRLTSDMTNEIWVGNNPISFDFFQTFGIKVIAGRDFSKAYANDGYFEDKTDISKSKGKLIVNETLALQLGWQPEQAIGQVVVLGNVNEGLHHHEIIGVVEDTHYINAKNVVPPMTYVLSAQPQDLSLRWLSVRLGEQQRDETIKALAQIWQILDSNAAFKYDWLASLFDANYRNESLQLTLLNILTILAIIVMAIGVFGVAAFTTQRRVKEIAVRKILGASNQRLCFMLINQFTLLIILANALAMPLVYGQVRSWLNGFVYRIDVPISAFVIAFVVSIAIAYFTILVIAFKAISAKPVNALAIE